jgi:hypothetical protein
MRPSESYIYFQSASLDCKLVTQEHLKRQQKHPHIVKAIILMGKLQQGLQRGQREADKARYTLRKTKENFKKSKPRRSSIG